MGKIVEKLVDCKTCWRQNTRFIVQPVGDDLLLYHEGQDEIFALNSVARRIWELCDGQRDEEGIVKELSEEYLVDQGQLRQDVRETLGTMVKRGLIYGGEREAKSE